MTSLIQETEPIGPFVPPLAPGFPLTPGRYRSRVGELHTIKADDACIKAEYPEHVFICETTCRSFKANGQWGVRDRATNYDLVERLPDVEMVTTEIVFEDVPVVAEPEPGVHHLVAQDLNTSIEGGVG
jgi:hypothetical protein